MTLNLSFATFRASVPTCREVMMFDRIALLFTAAIAPMSGYQQDYNFQTVDNLNAAGRPITTFLKCISNSGVIAGNSLYASRTLGPMGLTQKTSSRGITCTAGKCSRISGPLDAGEGAEVLSVNSSGELLIKQRGVYFISSADQSTFSPVGMLGRLSDSRALIQLFALTGVNDKGEVSGVYSTAKETCGVFGKAALGIPGTTSGPPEPGSYVIGSCVGNGTPETGPQVRASNGRGDITGFAAGQGFLCSNNVCRAIKFPGSVLTDPVSINSAGVVAGSYQPPSGKHRAFIFDGARFTTLEVPGADKSWALGINDRAQIVGQFQEAGGALHGFVATPTGPITNLLDGGKPFSATREEHPAGPVVTKLVTKGIVLNLPQSIALDQEGNVYVADLRAVWKISDKDTQLFAGGGPVNDPGDGGLARGAGLEHPSGVCVDFFGNVLIADDKRIRSVNRATGVITTVAGGGTGGSFGDGGPATDATLVGANSVAVDRNGDLYIAETGRNRIRKVTFSTGVISTVAGGGNAPPGQTGPATAAGLEQPYDLVFDSAGDLLIADTANGRIRKLSMRSGSIRVVAGSGQMGPLIIGVPALTAPLFRPTGIAADNIFNLYVSTQGALWKINGSTGNIQEVIRIAGRTARVDSKGNVYVAAPGDHAIYKITGLAK